MHSLSINETPFEQHYEILDEIGSGQFAVVRRVRHIATDTLYAAKFIKKFRNPSSRRQGVLRAHIEREVDILRSVSGHDGVVELVELFENPNEVVLVLEYVCGGELFEHVCQHEFLSESEAAQFLFQILRAVKHLHRMHIAHLDLKPENIILRERGQHFVKLIDFGLSRKLLPGSCVREMIGTPEFVAPEIINFEPLRLATDIWALGVVTFILLSGTSPFLGKTRDQTFANITAVNYQFPYGHSVTELAKDFIARLLVRDIAKRATVDECLRHEWIRRHVYPQQQQQQIMHHPLALHHKQKQQKNGHHLLLPINSTKSRAIRARWKKLNSAVSWCLAYLQSIDGREDSVHFKRDNCIISAIFIACERGALAQLKQLVHSCRIPLAHLVNELGESPLHVACGNGFQELAAFLIERGADPAHEDGRGDTALIWAARNGHAHLFNTFTLGPELINATNSIGETALHLATRYAQGQAVLALLERGADPQLQDKHGETPLHIAAWDGQSGLLDLLCRFCVELNTTNLQESSTTTTSRRSYWKKEQQNENLGGKISKGQGQKVPPNLVKECDATNGQTQMRIQRSRILRFTLLPIRGHLECVENLGRKMGPIWTSRIMKWPSLRCIWLLFRVHVEIALLLRNSGCNPNVQDQLTVTTPLAHRGGTWTGPGCTIVCANLDIPVDVQKKAFPALHLAARHVPTLTLCAVFACPAQDGMTAEIMALAQEQKQDCHRLLAKVRPEKVRRTKFVKQLSTVEGPLKRIKLEGVSDIQSAPSASSLNSLMESGHASLL
ncbi:hypothetical protein niasHS_004122 [Heterodera schachtii]|uniref:Protein kinase domain-containing protein n=1 Tax=Heterodera schachtii TaxID=97005 RepID=A0ABD2JY28_HETSC